MKEIGQKLMNTDELNGQILKDIENIYQKGGIERFERSQRVFIVEEVWTPEIGLLTDELKLKRKAIENKYDDVIEQLYQHKHLQSNKTNKNKDL